MAQQIRLEKQEGDKTRFIEFRLEAHNSVLRVWNVFDARGIQATKKDRENFQSQDDVSTYLKNQTKQLAAQGFRPAGQAAPRQVSKKSETDKKTDPALSADELS